MLQKRQKSKLVHEREGAFLCFSCKRNYIQMKEKIIVTIASTKSLDMSLRHQTHLYFMPHTSLWTILQGIKPDRYSVEENPVDFHSSLYSYPVFVPNSGSRKLTWFLAEFCPEDLAELGSWDLAEFGSSSERFFWTEFRSRPCLFDAPWRRIWYQQNQAKDIKKIEMKKRKWEEIKRQNTWTIASNE